MKAPKKEKSKINDLIRGFVATKIKQYLGKYLNNITKEDIQASFGTNSEITFSNIKLRIDAFDEFRLPIEVHPDSIVSEISCVLRMLPLQVNINVKGIRAIVMPNFKAWSPEQWKEYKSKKLEEWNEAKQHAFENLNLKSSKRQKINVVVNNINVSIKDIIIYFRDTVALSSPCIIRIRIEEIKVATTNSDFTHERPSESQHTTHRKISLRDFSLAIYSEYSDPNSFVPLEEIRFSERMYCIKPCIVNIFHTMKHKPLENEPTHTVKLEIPNLFFSINELQRQFIESLLAIIKNKKQYSAYEENRPICSVVGNEQKWWNYLIRTSRQDLNLSIAGLVKNKQDMDKYIDFYKSCQSIIHAPWLSDPNEEKFKFLAEMEEVYSLDKIISFRTLALYQLRIEAMSYVKARGNVRGKTHLGDLWDYYLNDFESLLGDPYKTVAEEHEIELTPEEKDELICLINMDKLNIVDSYLNGESSSRNDKILSLSIEINQFTMFIQETKAVDTFQYSPVAKSECVCGRCHQEAEANEPKNEAIVKENDEKNAQSKDVVYSIVMIDHNGNIHDPKLVKEHTLLVIEFNLKGTVLIHRDMHAENADELRVNNLDIWDPLTLQESKEIENFKNKYGFSVANDLLNMILQGKGQDFSLINSLRFFMQEMGLIPELEFILHHEDIFHKVAHFCKCKQKYSTLEAQKETFLNPSNKFCLHLTQSELQFYRNQSDLKSLYIKTYGYIKNFVMPRYIRNCIRWIISNTIRVNSSISALKIKLLIKGKSSPLEVKFVNRKKRKFEDKNIENVATQSEIFIESDSISSTISTETVQMLIKWMMKSHENFNYQKTFISTLTSTSPKLEYVKSIMNNMKKSGQQLQYIIKEKKKFYDSPNIKLFIAKLDLKLLETVFNNTKGNHVISNVLIKSLIFNSFMKHDNEAKAGQNRLDLQRDLKFYKHTETYVKSLHINTQQVPVIQIDELRSNSKDCIMNAHPYLIENILDFNVEFFKIFVRKELLSMLGLFNSIDFKPLKHFSKENIRKKNLQKEIFNHDKRAMREKLLTYQDQHYHKKNMKKCLHCILAYRKVCKMMNFSIGNSQKSSSGLEILLYNFKTKDKSIILKCPRVLGILEERVFNSTFRIYSENFEDSSKTITINFFEPNPQQQNNKNKSQSFDPNNISPIFPVFAHKITNLITDVAKVQYENQDTLYLILKINQRKDIKVFDFDLWKIREKLFERNEVDFGFNTDENKISNFINAMPENTEQLLKSREHNIKSDLIKLNIHSIEFNSDESLNNSYLLSVLFSISALGNLFNKYVSSQKANSIKSMNFVERDFKINSIIIKHIYNENECVLRINGLSFKTFPSFLQISGSRYEKKEVFEEKSVIYVKDIKLTLGSRIKMVLKPLHYIFGEKCTQVKIYNKSNKKISSQILKKLNFVDAGARSVQLQYRKPHIFEKNNIIAIPAKYNAYNHPLIDDASDLFAFKYFSNTKSKKNSEQTQLQCFISPIGIYVHGNKIVNMIKKFVGMTDLHHKFDLFDPLKTAENYIFVKAKKNIPRPLITNFRISKIFANILKKKSNRGSLNLKNIIFGNKTNENVYEGEIKLLKIHSNSETHKKIVVPLDRKKIISTRFSYDIAQNLINFTVNNAEVTFLMKFIEEITEVFSFISSSVPPSKIESKNEENSLRIELIFTNSSIFIPKSSESIENVKAQFELGRLITNDNEIVEWKLPKKSQQIENFEKEVSLLSEENFDLVKCLKLHITLDNLRLFMNNDDIGFANSLEMTIFTPKISEYDDYILKNKVSMEFSNVNFNVSLGKMKKIEDLINSNLEESVDERSRVFKSKNTKIKIKILSGSLGISRWVTLPIPEVQLNNIEENENINLDEIHLKHNNDNIEEEYKDQNESIEDNLIQEIMNEIEDFHENENVVGDLRNIIRHENPDVISSGRNNSISELDTNEFYNTEGIQASNSGSPQLYEDN